MVRKNAFWDRLDQMRGELGAEEAQSSDAGPPIQEEELPPEIEEEPLGVDSGGLDMDKALATEDPLESLVRRFDHHMDLITRDTVNVIKSLIDLSDYDSEFTPTKERIKECFSRGVVPYLEDADRVFEEFFPEADPRKRRVK